MKIHVANLGVVTEAHIDLKPLTVFIGENGTGKTWTAYAIAGLLGPYGYRRYLDAYLDDKTAFKFPPLEAAVQSLLDTGGARLNLKQFASDYAQRYLNEVAALMPHWLDRFMATKRTRFDHTTLSVEFPPDFTDELIEKLKDGRVQFELSVGTKNASRLFVNALKEKGDEDLYYYITTESQDVGEISTPVKEREVRKFVVSTLNQIIHRAVAPNTPIFPTERTTFITLPFLSVQAKPEDSLSGEDMGKELEYLAEPVRYLLVMLGSSMRRFFHRKEQKQEDPRIANFVMLADLLESDVLSGNVDFEDYGGSIELVYKLEDNTRLELNVSSSMVKELAPLALYLKYLAYPDELIVIDEPEMNLHPSAQAKMTEFIAMLVHYGLRVLITTHSPYIVDHLANLMLAAECGDKAQIKDIFYLERPESFISKENVSIYLFEDGTAKAVLSETGQTDYGTFSDVSRELGRMYSRLLSSQS